MQDSRGGRSAPRRQPAASGERGAQGLARGELVLQRGEDEIVGDRGDPVVQRAAGPRARRRGTHPVGQPGQQREQQRERDAAEEQRVGTGSLEVRSRDRVAELEIPEPGEGHQPQRTRSGDPRATRVWTSARALHQRGRLIRRSAPAMA